MELPENDALPGEPMVIQSNEFGPFKDRCWYPMKMETDCASDAGGSG